MRISSASLLTLDGPGLRHGLLDETSGDLVQIHTGGAASPGHVKVRVGGPTGEAKQTPRGRGSRSEWEDLQVRQNR